MEQTSLLLTALTILFTLASIYGLTLAVKMYIMQVRYDAFMSGFQTNSLQDKQPWK